MELKGILWNLVISVTRGAIPPDTPLKVGLSASEVDESLLFDPESLKKENVFEKKKEIPKTCTNCEHSMDTETYINLHRMYRNGQERGKHRF